MIHALKLVNFSPLSGEMIKQAVLDRTSLPGPMQVVDCHGMPEQKLIAVVADADVIFGDFTLKTRITATIAAAVRKVKLIQQPTAGFDHIDIAACRQAGIPVANTPGANDTAVAEHTLMLALACLKKLTQVHNHTRAGDWLQERALEMGICELTGKTYGLLGMGHTARALALRLRPFDVVLKYHSRHPLTAEEEQKYHASYLDLDDLLGQADILSIHLPLTEDTRGMIGAREFDLMKPGAVLINVARGGIVDEAALVRALQDNKLAAAGIDVFEQEPIDRHNPLLALDNVIVTSHVAGATVESGQRIFSMAIENIARVLSNQTALHLV